ncbi:hypothetical protein QH494_20910 [Sphingomonas sp. AR_OL41]|uniref:hypothetical protein n=1 Tax=Sphingomonas sp. AR_OL41 TaxID=3042729 RepID=UPI002480DED5|nr:hypothetical protein [Sphingomonas sp. AR_OL41]MDH7974659.1 hypothetical protein [Sphingomonas sp. AR_OL41]
MTAPTIPPVTGGALAGVIMASWAAATVFWMGLGATIWRLFSEPRLKDMKAQLDAERRRCDEEVAALRDRVKQLETMLLLHGPAALRQQMKAALTDKERGIPAIRDAARG